MMKPRRSSSELASQETGKKNWRRTDRSDETIAILIPRHFFSFSLPSFLPSSLSSLFPSFVSVFTSFFRYVLNSESGNIKPWTERRMWSSGGCCFGADCLPGRVPWGSVASSGTWPATSHGTEDPGSSRRNRPHCKWPNRRNASI